MAEPEKQELDSDEKMLKEIADKLGEHFDTVHIFATRHEGEKKATIQLDYGVGNWHARYGWVKHWVLNAEEITRIRARANAKDDE